MLDQCWGNVGNLRPMLGQHSATFDNVLCLLGCRQHSVICMIGYPYDSDDGPILYPGVNKKIYVWNERPMFMIHTKNFLVLYYPNK